MKRFLLSILFFVGLVSLGFGQTTYFSIPAGGNWNNAATWDIGDDFTGGDGIPGPNDVAVILGDGAGGGNVLLTANQTVGDVYVQYDNPNVLSKGGFFLSTFTLTINGQLAGVDFLGGGAFAEPTTAVIQTNQRLNLVFTGANIGTTSFNPVITSWGNGSPLRNIRFNGSTTSTNMEVENFNLFGGSTLNLTNGILTVLAGNSISQASNASISTSGGTNLIVNGSITGDGLPASRINNINIQGNVTTGTSGYINADNFTLGSSSTFTINFAGANQTQGWWYQSTFPTTPATIDPTSTIIYNSASAQTVGAENISYGNLTIGGNTTKSLAGTGNLDINGDLTIIGGSTIFDTSGNPNPIDIAGNIDNNGSLNATQTVLFDGTVSQQINGNNIATFGGGIRVENTAGLVLSNIGVDIDGILDIDPTCSFDPSDQTVTMSGDFRVDGDLIAGTSPGGFVFDGTTQFLGSGTRAFYNVDIDAAGTLTAPTGTMEVHANWTNDGVFNDNLGTVLFSNPDPISISGGSTTSFYNLSLSGSNTATVNIDGTVDLENVMSFIGSPTVDFDGSANNGTFTVKSTATRDAAIGNIGSATLQGNAVVERYITGGSGEFRAHYLGSPIATTISDWQNEFYVTGNFTNSSTGPGINSGTPSLYIYNEAAAVGLNEKWEPYPTTNEAAPIELGVGYGVYLRDEQATVTANTVGEIKTGTATWNVSDQGGADDGWNLIANQFPAAVDFDAAGWDKTNIENGYYVYDPNAGVNKFYTSGGGSSAGMDQYIAMGQAFWVRATASGTLTAAESVKYTGGTPDFFREAPIEKIKITMEGNGLADDSYIIFNPGATDDYDAEYDFSNLRNEQHNISTLSNDSKDLKVNHMAALNATEQCGRSIPLFVRSESTGSYTLKFEEFSTLRLSESVQLIDNFTDKVIDIQEGTLYEFDITADASSKGSERFLISFQTKIPNEVETITGDVCPGESGSIVLKATDNFADYLIYKGNEIITGVAGTGGDLSVKIESENLSENLNDFMVKAFVAGCDTIAVASAQVQVFDALDLSNRVTGSTVCGSDSQAPFTVETQVGAVYYILDAQDTLQTITGNGNLYKGNLAIESLSAGVNVLSVGLSKDACQQGILSQELEINVNDMIIDQNITFNSTDVCSGNTASVDFTGQEGVLYKFYKDNRLVNTITATGISQSVEIAQTNLSLGSNEFTVKASAGECAQYEFADKVVIDVGEQINQDLEISNANSCGSSNAVISIINAQSGKTYKLISDQQAVGSALAKKDGVLDIELAADNLEVGVNRFDILIEGQNCTALNANQRAEVNYVESAVIEEVSDYSICLNESVVIDLAANVEMSSYHLYVGDELLVEETGTSLSISPEETTTYSLIGIASESCAADTINFTIEVTNLSKPGILVSDNVLESSITGDAYQWYLDGELLSDETGKLVVVNESGDYSLEVTKANCSSISDVFNFNEEVLQADQALENALNFYPNPVGDKMFVELNNINSVNITIFTINGLFVDSFKVDEANSEIDMSKYSKGNYLIQFESQDKSITKRIIKQ